MQFRPKILIAEDEKVIALDLKRTLTKQNYDVVGVVSSALEVIQKADEEKPDLILMDIMLGGYLNGIEAAKIISFNSNARIIYLTALKDADTIKKANVPAPYLYITKPYKDEELTESIDKALKLRIS